MWGTARREKWCLQKKNKQVFSVCRIALLSTASVVAVTVVLQSNAEAACSGSQTPSANSTLNCNGTVSGTIEPTGGNVTVNFADGTYFPVAPTGNGLFASTNDNMLNWTLNDGSLVKSYSGGSSFRAYIANGHTITLNGSSLQTFGSAATVLFDRPGGNNGDITGNTVTLNSTVANRSQIYAQQGSGISFLGTNTSSDIRSNKIYATGTPGLATEIQGHDGAIRFFSGGDIDQNYISIDFGSVIASGSTANTDNWALFMVSTNGSITSNELVASPTQFKGRRGGIYLNAPNTVSGNQFTFSKTPSFNSVLRSYDGAAFSINNTTGTTTNNTVTLNDGFSVEVLSSSSSLKAGFHFRSGSLTSGNTITLNGSASISAVDQAVWFRTQSGQANDNMVTLNNTSIVYSSTKHAVEISAATSSGNQITLNDSSQISAVGNNAHGVYLNTNGANTITVNSGAQISATGAGAIGVKDGPGNSTIIVGGTVSGTVRSVDLGDGNDELRMKKGAVLNGIAEGGFGTDTIRLTESGSWATGVSLFEYLEMDGVAWSIDDTTNMGGTGIVNINSGKLTLNSNMNAGTINVNSGGTFMGTATFSGTAIVHSGGTIAPGSSIGTLTGDNFSFASGSTLEIEVSDVAADKLDATGTVNIDGANLVVKELDFTGAGLSSFTIIENDLADPVTGSGFSSITDDLALFDASVDLAGGDGNDVVLTLAQVAMAAQVAETENQQQVGDVVDQLMNDPNLSSEAQILLNEISALSTEELLNALDSLSGDGLGNLADLSISDVESVLDILSNRFGIVLGDRVARGAQITQVASAAFSQISSGFSPIATDGVFATTMTDAPILASVSGLSKTFSHDSGFSAWIEGFGTFGDLESGDANTADTDYRLFGTTAGIDYTFDSGVLAGLSIGYSKSKADVDTRQTEVDGDTFRLSAFGGANIGSGYVAGALSYAFTDFDGQRFIPLLSSTALSNFNADEITGYVEGGYAFNAIGELIVEPAVSMRYTNFQTDGYTETGAGAANLTVSDRETNSISGSVGARLRQEVKLDTGLRLTPEFKTFLNHEFDETERVINAALAGGSFTVQGTKAPRTTATVGGGVSVMLADRARLFVNYDAELADRLTEQTVAGTLQWQF